MSTRLLALHCADVCTPWRIATPLGALAAAGYDVSLALLEGTTELPAGVDLLVLQSPGTAAALRLLEQAREAGVGTVVDFDDLFGPSFLRTSWLVSAQGSAPGDGDPRQIHADVLRRFHACLRAADAVTVSTPDLAAAYASLNPNISVLPNCFNDANPFWSLAPPKRDTVNVGFAGTGDHRENLALVKEALEGVLRQHRSVRLVEAGKPELGPNLLDQIDAPPEQLVHLGEVSFDLFPLVLQQMDVVLAPLVDSPFARCKSNIRCMTAGVVGVPVVASPVGTYAKYIRHGVNGFLAASSGEWRAGIEALLLDSRRRHAMGEANREAARAYSISANWSRWSEVYERVLLSRGPRA